MLMTNFSQSSNLTTTSQAVAAIEEQDTLSISSSIQEINKVSDTQGGFAICLLFFCYVCIGVWYKKSREEKKLALQKQIETLERIWHMRPYRR